jgi:GxxExxY protein
VDTNDITGAILSEAISLHREIGPGLLESVYEALLARRLEKRGFRVHRQQPIQLQHDGVQFDEAFRADLIVQGIVIVEIKAVERINAVFARTLLTYLRLTGLPIGLLINFGGIKLMDGVKRVINTPRESGSTSEIPHGVAAHLDPCRGLPNHTGRHALLRGSTTSA